MPASGFFLSSLDRKKRILRGSVCGPNCSSTEDIKSHIDLMKKTEELVLI